MSDQIKTRPVTVEVFHDRIVVDDPRTEPSIRMYFAPRDVEVTIHEGYGYCASREQRKSLPKVVTIPQPAGPRKAEEAA